MKDVSIVIVSWKVRDLVLRCLRSLYAAPPAASFEVFLVDNASGDGTVEAVLGEFPQVELMANTKNLGFAAGNNPAIARSQGEFVLLLNPDTEITGRAIDAMVAYMAQHHGIGILGPRLVGADGALQPSVRRFPTFASQALIMLKLHHVLRPLPPLRRYFADDFDYDKDQAVDQVMGAAFMVRRSMLERIGLLDERFFVWFEEVDLCKRAKDAGFEVRYAPVATVLHRGGESFGQVFGPAKQRHFNKSLRQYFLKHHGVLPWLGLAILHPASMALAWLAALAKTAKKV